MNVTNNRRRRDSKRRIEAALEKLLQEKTLGQIRVTEICQLAGVNRTTFYANYEDVNALAQEYQDALLQRMLTQYQQEVEARQSSFDFAKLFRHIYENQLDYKTYFRLNPGSHFDWRLCDRAVVEKLFRSEQLDYHIAFFGNGLNAMIKLWLENGCRETPEEMAEVIISEYAPKGSALDGGAPPVV